MLDGGRAHFKSFAEMGTSCQRPAPDLLGITSRIARVLLSRITPSHPLDIDLAKDARREAAKTGEEERKAEFRWTSGVTGMTYAFPLNGEQ